MQVPTRTNHTLIHRVLKLYSWVGSGHFANRALKAKCCPSQKRIRVKNAVIDSLLPLQLTLTVLNLSSNLSYIYSLGLGFWSEAWIGPPHPLLNNGNSKSFAKHQHATNGGGTAKLAVGLICVSLWCTMSYIGYHTVLYQQKNGNYRFGIFQ